MIKPDEEYVYHGSWQQFKLAEPRRHQRGRIDKNGERVFIFDDISFHATPYKWIGLAYTYTPVHYEIDGKTAHYNIAIDLYKHHTTLDILGFENLERSLQKLYGHGGYLMTFNRKDFFHTKGLGNLEVITQKTLEPLKIERVEDPVAEMKKLGIEFRFVDLGLPENEKYCNYQGGVGAKL